MLISYVHKELALEIAGRYPHLEIFDTKISDSVLNFKSNMEGRRMLINSGTTFISCVKLNMISVCLVFVLA